jgi:hypothetical protein
MKFPYAQYGSYYMPIIPVTLGRGDSCVVTEALVDSGAARCIFDAQLAAMLGIPNVTDGADPIVFEGVTGDTFVGYEHSVSLTVGGQPIHDVQIAFAPQMPDNAVNILGQQGFFDICPIKFTLTKREIDVMLGSRKA